MSDTLEFLNWLKLRLISRNFQVYRVYAPLKVHKISWTPCPSDFQLRRLHSCKGLKISSWRFQRASIFPPKYSIKNNSELVSKLKNLSIPKDSIMVSFDIHQYLLLRLSPSFRIYFFILTSQTMCVRTLCHFSMLAYPKTSFSTRMFRSKFQAFKLEVLWRRSSQKFF